MLKDDPEFADYFADIQKNGMSVSGGDSSYRGVRTASHRRESMGIVEERGVLSLLLTRVPWLRSFPLTSYRPS